MSTQSLPAVEHRLARHEVLGGEDRDLDRRRAPSAGLGRGVVERVVGEEQVDGRVVPPDLCLAIACDERPPLRRRRDAERASGATTSSKRSAGTNTFRSMSIVARARRSRRARGATEGVGTPRARRRGPRLARPAWGRSPRDHPGRVELGRASPPRRPSASDSTSRSRRAWCARSTGGGRSAAPAGPAPRGPPPRRRPADEGCRRWGRVDPPRRPRSPAARSRRPPPTRVGSAPAVDARLEGARRLHALHYIALSMYLNRALSDPQRRLGPGCGSMANVFAA